MPELAGFEDFVEIGRGGFGVVYRAHQPALNRYVAIKFLAASLSSTGRERLSREALAMGALSGHPNIVAVVDVGIPVEGTPYLIMPYLARGSLADTMAASGPQPWPEVVRIGVKLAGALESAHRLGILHRDVKPGNILVSDFGEPQLADFGLARVSGGFETTSRHITASVAHAAPEILEGRAAERRVRRVLARLDVVRPRRREPRIHRRGRRVAGRAVRADRVLPGARARRPTGCPSR